MIDFNHKLHDDLIAEAAREEARARQFDGCSFVGEHPGSFHHRRASLLRQAAIALARKEVIPMAKKAVARKPAAKKAAPARKRGRPAKKGKK